MSTKRTPINRRTRFTPRAIAIFKRMIEDDCIGEEYDKLGKELCLDELKLGLAEGYPPIVFPWHEPLRPPDMVAGQWERVKGPRLFRELCQAAGIDPKEFEEETTEEA